MHVYNVVNPSDPITFKAESDEIAFFCVLYLGQGKAGCYRLDERGNEDISINTMLFMIRDEKVLKESIKTGLGGKNMDEFFQDNKAKIADAFDSFMYGSFSERKMYDDALEAITEPEKKKEFRDKHEDRNRTSMSQWVKSAWNLAASFRKNKDDEKS